MSTVWTTILGVAILTALIKGAGPVVLGGRTLPGWFSRVVVLMAPALLAALVVTSALADGDEWHVGADTLGVAAAGVAVWRRASAITVVLVAAGVTAAARALA